MGLDDNKVADQPAHCHFLSAKYFISEFTSTIQYILMFSGTGFDSKLKLILKSFPITMWIIQYYIRMALAINVRT